MKRFLLWTWPDCVPPLALTAITAGYLYTAYQYDAEARLIPVAAAWVMLFLLAFDLLALTDTAAGRFVVRVLNPSIAPEERFGVSRQVSAIGWPLLFTFLLVVTGVLSAVLIYVFGSLHFHGKWSRAWSLGVAVASTATVWLLFEAVLQMRLYSGIFFAG